MKNECDYWIPKIKDINNIIKKVTSVSNEKIRRLLDRKNIQLPTIDDTLLIFASPNLLGWSKNNIKIFVEREKIEKFKLPNINELQKKYNDIKVPSWNEPKYFINNWVIKQTNNDININITFGESSTYENAVIEYMAQNPLFLTRDNRYKTLYEAYIDNDLNFFRHLPNLITVTPVIISKDNKLIITRRSNKVFYYPGHWEISISEQMRPDFDGYRENYFFGAIDRGIKEELSIEIIVDETKILGLYREIGNLNCNISAITYLSSTYSEIMDYRKCHNNQDEMTMIEGIEWNINNAITLLKKTQFGVTNVQESQSHFHPSSRIRLLLAILASFPMNDIHDNL